jgi:hypothetical protein
MKPHKVRRKNGRGEGEHKMLKDGTKPHLLFCQLCWNLREKVVSGARHDEIRGKGHHERQILRGYRGWINENPLLENERQIRQEQGWKDILR